MENLSHNNYSNFIRSITQIIRLEYLQKYLIQLEHGLIKQTIDGVDSSFHNSHVNYTPNKINFLMKFLFILEKCDFHEKKKLNRYLLSSLIYQKLSNNKISSFIFHKKNSF